MDESTYNNVYRNASPMTPSTPSNAFQTNVNRSKTRKWVEAKKQNYDGDDWGNDYDDEEPEEDEPPPKPTGLRQFEQVAQPPTPQTSGNRAFSQPTAAFGHIRGESFGRNTSGPPALHIQTQQPISTKRFEPVETISGSHPPSFGAAPDRATLENVTSPQSGSSRPSVPEPGYPGRGEFSPTSQERGSPAPANTGALPSRFPPRKSSMGQQDAPGYADAPGNRSSSRPGSSGRPWMDQRSNSPGHQAPASAGAPNKPLPFIRPADIYRRMEEEKEKDRRSMESAGRPSMDSIQGTGSDRSSSPANALRPAVDQRRRTSFERDESLESSRGLRPTLAPVAERRSEYGLDRLINQADAARPAEASQREPHMQSQEAFSSAPTEASASDSSFVQPLNGPEDRRKSVSPRLPDLARMSGFGADFFSGPSGFPDADEPAQPTLFGRKSTSQSVEREAGRGTPTQQADGAESKLVQRGPSLLEGPALVEEKENGLRLPQIDSVEPPNSSLPNSDFQASSMSNEATVKERSRPSRPSIPGGWVSETTNFGSEAPTPMDRPEPSMSQLSPVQDGPEPSPITDAGTGDLAPTTTVKHAQSLDGTPKALDEAQSSQEQSRDGFGDTVGDHDPAVANKVIAAGPGYHPIPQTLPPLQTHDPLAISSSPATETEPEIQGIGSPASGDSPSNYSTSTHPRTATMSSGFTPTAPLNPKRNSASASDFVAPDFLPRNLTMSSMDATSPNESDKLREDIIKSLSPVDPASAFPVPSGANRSALASSPEMARESRYLSGVYDDYMGPTEDKSLQEIGQVLKDEAANTTPIPIQSSPARTIVPEGSNAPGASSNLPKSPDHGLGLKKRFSWEQGLEEVTTSPAEAPQEHAPEAEASTNDVEASTDGGLGVRDITPTPALQVEPDAGGTMSHQVSLVSSHAPGGLGLSGIEPPSPISVLSAERSPGSMDNRGKRLSLADEKVLIQASSNPVSPSPEEEHPALVRGPPGSTPSPENSNPIAPPPKSFNITGWREILSIPSPALRIQKFDEARLQYLSMDSGLSNWIEHMNALPEDTALPASIGSPSTSHAPGVASHGLAQSSPTGPPTTTQQPYYQQYLNASNPNIVSAPPGPVRQSTGNLLSGQPSSSGFGNPQTQVGVKGKEFLHAAGVFGNKATKAGMKGGMKLFNKGKDKLRGSGNKDHLEPQLHAQLDSPPPTTLQTVKPRNERRSSWGLSLIGSRPKARQGSAAHPNKHAHSSSLSLIQHLVHRSPGPKAPAAPAPAPARPPGTGRPRARAPSAHQPIARARAASNASASASVPNLTSRAAPGASLPSNLTLPQLPLPRTSSPSRPSSFLRSRPSSWLSLTGDRHLFPPSTRNTSSVEVARAPRSPPQAELVLPISTSTASPTRRIVNLTRDDELRVSKPAPISKLQPTWDPYTATPLVEEEDFDLRTPVREHQSAAPLASPATRLVARDAAYLTTDERSDAWVEVIDHQSVIPPSSLPRSMTATVMASRPVASPLQYSQQDDGPAEAPRVNSFVGLPPIRRTSTFGLLGGKNGQSDDSECNDSPIAHSEDDIPPVPAIPSGMDHQTSNGYHMASQPRYSQTPPPQQPTYPQQALQNTPQAHSGNWQNGYHPPAEEDANGFLHNRGTDQGNGVAPQQSGFAPGPPSAQQPTTGRGGPGPGVPLSQFNVQAQNGSLPPSGQPYGQQGMRPGMTSPPAAGNPIHRFPPQGQWKLEESHLSEPLNTSRKTQSPPSQQPGYYAEDKETESPAPGGPSSQPPQRSTRNNGLPPVSAQRFPGLFPAGSSNQSPVQQDQIQITPAAQHAQQQRRDSMGASRILTDDLEDPRRQSQSGLLNQIGGKFLPHRGRSDSVSKDGPTVQADEVSVSETSILTDEPREKKHKRISFFGIGNPSNDSDPPPPSDQADQPMQQEQQFGPLEKKKTFFGAGALAKQMTNLGGGGGKADNSSVNNDVNASHGAGPKKRLSELKGMFKGGQKDDHHPVKPEVPQPNRPSMQGPIQPPTRSSNGHQGPLPGHPQQFGQSGMMAPPPVNRGRSSTQGSVQGPPMGLPPNMGQLRPQHTGDGKERKASTGGFLGSLFGNRPGSSTKDSKPPQTQQMQPGMPSVQQQPRPGQMLPPGQTLPQRMIYPGQPGFPQGQPGQTTSFQGQPGPQGQHPALMQMGQHPGMPGPQGSQGYVQQARQPGLAQPTAIPGPGGAMAAMRQPSQPNIPIQGQPGIPPQQASQNSLKPEGHQYKGALGSNPVTPSGEHERTLAAPTDDFSPRSSQDHLSVGGSSLLPRVLPNRKPVGSGPSRTASGNIVTIQQEGLDSQSSRTPEPPNEFGGDGQQGPAAISSIHQSPRPGVPSSAEHIRHPSLPTPSHSPAPGAGSPETQGRLSSQFNQPQASPLSQQQAFNEAPRPLQSGPVSNREGVPSPMRLPSGQVVWGPQGQPGQPGQAGRGQPTPLPGSGPQQGQPLQPWGFTRTATQPQNLSGPAGQQQPAQHGQGRGTPGPVPDQKGTMSKLFSGVGKRRDSTSPQPPVTNQAVQSKEKESTSSKLFGAFKRTKQQDQPHVQQQQQQQRPVQGQQMHPPMMQGAVMQGARGQMPSQPAQPGQVIPPRAMQAGRGPSMLGASPSQGPFGGPGQQQGPSPGAQPPPQMQGDRGQLPLPSQTRVGHGQISPTVMPMMQPNRSQTGVQRHEPQYASVPIPRGYEAVHGYGVPNMVAHSPYNVGRGSPPQQFGPQFQPIVPQYTGTSQQFQPLLPQHTGASQHIQQMVPQHTDATQADPRLPSPAFSQMAQSQYVQSQGQVLPQCSTPTNITRGPYHQEPRSQGQLPHLRSQDPGSPAPQQQSITAQPPASQSPITPAQHHQTDARSSPHPQPGQETFLSTPSARDSEQDFPIQTPNGNLQVAPTQPQHSITAVEQPSRRSESLHTDSPQNQPLPDSAATFPPVNVAAGKLAHPPLPPTASSDYIHSQQPVGNISHTPSPPVGIPNAGHPSVRHVVSSSSIVDEPRGNSLTPDVAPPGAFSVSPEPPGSRPPPVYQQSIPNLDVNISKANSHTPDHEDLYDATPRNTDAPRPQQVPIQNAAIQHDNEIGRGDHQGAAIAGGAAAGVAAGAIAYGGISRTSSYQVETPQQTGPAQTTPMEPEEKILVDQPVELAAVNDDGNDLPMMSATSYPGQEWNPYGAGEFGDWE
ncbi:hypothetical protein SCAR479_11202 [Seiridium cardinale]|uniref:Uncharacterized protein n=1 Tax=Seiridium cardinale TaxID=138064 RepID=A0ABR2XEG1_9PEZI